MKIYLAGRFAQKETLQDARAALKVYGFTVTSRWLDGDAGTMTDTAIMDLEDIESADALVLLADEPEEGERPMQGALVEFGYAIALNKRVFVIDKLKKRTVFFSLPEITFCHNWQHLYDTLAAIYQHPTLFQLT